MRSYAASSDGASSDTDEDLMRRPITLENCKSLAVRAEARDVAPLVVTKEQLGGVRCVDPHITELDYNPKYEELFQPVVCLILTFLFLIALLRMSIFRGPH